MPTPHAFDLDCNCTPCTATYNAAVRQAQINAYHPRSSVIADACESSSACDRDDFVSRVERVRVLLADYDETASIASLIRTGRYLLLDQSEARCHVAVDQIPHTLRFLSQYAVYASTTETL